MPPDSSVTTPVSVSEQVAQPMRLRRFLLVLSVTAIGALVAMTLLPHDKYLRYQALNDHAAPRAYWIYERIHSDPTPIDIAFIGTSRTGRSIHTARLEKNLAEAGIHVKAANLFLYKTGRNMHYVLAKELLQNRKVKLLVLEITELEDRKPHPDFVFLADANDIAFAPWFINLSYLSDLARLPGRQVDLFLQTQLTPLGIRKPDFVPPPYEGPNLDISEYLTTLDGQKHYFVQQHSREEMEALRHQQDASITPSVLPGSLSSLEYRFPRYYVERILELAAETGTRVVFLYVPRYGGPPTPPPYSQYARRAPLINPGTQMQDFRLWDEVTHLNWYGSQVLTDAVAAELARGNYLGPPDKPPSDAKD